MRSPLPLPRLRCIKPGEAFILRGESKLRTLINADRHHGYYKDGYASLCHPLDSVNLEWAPMGGVQNVGPNQNQWSWRNVWTCSDQ